MSPEFEHDLLGLEIVDQDNAILLELLEQNAAILELNKKILERLCNPLVTMTQGKDYSA